MVVVHEWVGVVVELWCYIVAVVGYWEGLLLWKLKGVKWGLCWGAGGRRGG